MSTDVGTTQRKRLSPTKRLALFEKHKGVCALCGQQIRSGSPWIVEHLTALALGGANDADNLAPVHQRCADAKTAQEDAPRIVKAKAQKRAALGLKRDGPKIRSAGFAKVERNRAIDKSCLPELPRRKFYD